MTVASTVTTLSPEAVGEKGGTEGDGGGIKGGGSGGGDGGGIMGGGAVGGHGGEKYSGSTTPTSQQVLGHKDLKASGDGSSNNPGTLLETMDGDHSMHAEKTVTLTKEEEEDLLVVREGEPLYAFTSEVNTPPHDSSASH